MLLSQKSPESRKLALVRIRQVPRDPQSLIAFTLEDLQDLLVPVQVHSAKNTLGVFVQMDLLAVWNVETLTQGIVAKYLYH